MLFSSSPGGVRSAWFHPIQLSSRNGTPIMGVSFVDRLLLRLVIEFESSCDIWLTQRNSF